MAGAVSELIRAAGVLGPIFKHVADFFGSLLWPKVHSVQGEIALITGGGSGIGRLMALRLAERGVTVVIWDLNEKMAMAVADEITSHGHPRAYAYQIDVTDRQRVYALAQQVKQEVGEVTMLINNAGIVSGKSFLETPDELCVKTMEVNTMAHFWTVKAFVPAMMAKNHGYLVTIASTAGYIGMPKMADYCASKFAAVGFDESIRNELAAQGKTGVHTLCVCPIFINTGMFEGVKTKFPFLFPLLDQNWVADKIVYAIQTHTPMLMLPATAYLAPFLRGILPTRAVDAVGQYLGLYESMADFKGRAAKQAALKTD